MRRTLNTCMSTFYPTARATIIEFVSEFVSTGWPVALAIIRSANQLRVHARSRRRPLQSGLRSGLPRPIHLHGIHNKSIMSFHEEVGPRNHASTRGVDRLCQIALSRIRICVANIKSSRRAAQMMYAQTM